MTAKEIYSKTKKFPTRLLLLNIICAVVGIILFALFMVVGLIFKSEMALFWGIIVSIGAYGFLHSIIYHYVGYMFKYGSVHAIAMAHASGSVSSSYFDDSVEYIKSGFLKANAYFVVDRLVSAAVRGVTKIANFILGFLPDNLKSMVDTFINIYLNYIDECCLAWSMLHPEENVIKTSCDGVTIYYQNAKDMLKPAFGTTLRVILTKGAIVLIGMLLMVFPIAGLLWWMLAFAIVSPYLEHRILCNTMVSYLDLAYKTQINPALYNKLNKCKPFQKLQARMDDPMFDVAPGNESVNVKTMRRATEDFEQTEYDSYEETESVDIGQTLASAAQTIYDGVKSKITAEPEQPQQRAREPIHIPDPPVEEPTREQVLWQSAWNRMTPEQKNKYNGMNPQSQKAWKAQILKALYNFEA